MLNKIRQLINRSTKSEATCDSELMRLIKEEAEVALELKMLAEQLRDLDVLLGKTLLNKEVVNRDKIFIFLNKVAVINQKKAVIRLRERSLYETQIQLNQEITKQKTLKKFWWLKGKRYEYLKALVLKEMARKEFQQDETEQEEKYNGVHKNN